jgi:hypothetical protein
VDNGVRIDDKGYLDLRDPAVRRWNSHMVVVLQELAVMDEITLALVDRNLNRSLKVRSRRECLSRTLRDHLFNIVNSGNVRAGNRLGMLLMRW